jgi:hypothetical protein
VAHSLTFGISMWVATNDITDSTVFCSCEQHDAGCPFYWMRHTAHAVGVTELHSPDISSDLLVLIVIKLRITIERAFGQLVRRFGILWCANSSRLRNVATMVLACAKLHNICVD